LHTQIGKNAREIGYWINKKYAHQGLATEAVQALIQVAFDIESIDRLEIHCAPENTFSQKIPQKLGFSYEATLKHRATDSQGQPNTMIWSLFSSDYDKMQAVKINISAYDACRRLI
jgi:RimJ/RimL family protein N-acetyltransferase